MKNKIIFLIIISNLFFSFSQANYSDNEVIIKFKKQPIKDKANKIIFSSKLKKINKDFTFNSYHLIGDKRTFVFHFLNNINIIKAIKKYKNTGLFEFVEPNFKCFRGGKKGIFSTFPDDTFLNRQWYLYNDGSFSLSTSVADADIDMELAWDIEQGDSNIIVAVLDTGTKLDHPELNNRIWINSNESFNNIDQDGNGLIDDVVGWDFVNNDNNPIDEVGHGTNVIGIIGAKANNNIGYSGMDWNCKLMTCKVLDNNNSGYYSWMINAIHYAVDNGAKVINMSIGGSSYSVALEDAIDYAYDNNVTIVACMMNFNNQTTYYPAGFLHTIAVGSTDSNDQRSNPFFWDLSSGSNFGNHIDVVAPGNYIYGLSNTSNNNYNTYWGGTSQATPQVTALCSLLLAQDPTRNPDELRAIIQNTAEDQIGLPQEDTQGFDIYYGYGRINAYDALNYTNLNSNDLQFDEFKILPTIVKDNIYFKGKIIGNKIEIFNALGQKNFSEKILNRTNINLSSLKNGIYFIKIKKNNRTIFSKKIIKI